jgi:hypothetical protein
MAVIVALMAVQVAHLCRWQNTTAIDRVHAPLGFVQKELRDAHYSNVKASRYLSARSIQAICADTSMYLRTLNHAWLHCQAAA